MAKSIKDPIHGYITLHDEWVDSIVDTQHFQRLRNIRQLDTTRTVYPSANHTRFDHTLGVYHLGSQAFESISSDADSDFENVSQVELERLQRTFECACLCHDIGHFPFSHLGEGFVDQEDIRETIQTSRYNLKSRLQSVGRASALARGEAGGHELMGCAIVLEELGQDIEDAFDQIDVDPVEVCAFILGTTTRDDSWQWEATAKLLSSQIDVDRLDYMLRDNHMSGASLVSVDSERMVEAYTTVNEKLALSTKAHSTIGNYLQGRNNVYLWIAQHHKVVYSNAVVELMIHQLHNQKNKTGFTSNDVIERGIDDAYLIQELRSHALNGGSDLLTQLFEKYRQRDYLTSCWSHALDWDSYISSGVKDDLFAELKQRQDRFEFEEWLADELGVSRHQVIARNSSVSGYNYEDLTEIVLDHNGNDEKITQFDFYQTQPELFRPVPYLFVPEEQTDKAIEKLGEI